MARHVGERPRCPDCGSARQRALGVLPDVAAFAGRRLDAPLAGGRLWHCADCDLRHRHPQLARAEYDRLYDNTQVDAWEAAPLRRDQQLVKRVIEARPGAKSLLDFGCYTGDFLAALPPQLQRCGVEVNRRAAALAAQRAGAEVLPGLDAFAADRRFDVIVSMDVIEHVASPRRLLEALLARLAQGGLLVLTTGDGGHWLWRIAAARWWYCFFPEHIAFVSRGWLRHHAASLGARVVEVRNFNYLEQPGPGALKRWRVFLRYLARPRRHARRRERELAERGHDIGVPGIGLTRDHLLVVLTK
jgi:SAM-dependent methyltransferase